MGGLFDDVLKGDEGLFVDELALDYDYIPKEIPYRENQQHYIADCMKPLFNSRSGRNLFIFGSPGIGKTAAIKYIFRELENNTDDVIPIYVNCWKKDSSYKVLMDICDQIGYKWTHNKRTDELMRVISTILNKKSVVICLDEVDRVKELDILYSLCEDLTKKVILVLANDRNWLANLDARVRSRLMAESLEFKPYNFDEIKGILKKRIDYAFVPDIWENEALDVVNKKCYTAKDIRVGLFLLRESGNLAEMKSSKKIIAEYASSAVSKLEEFKIKDCDEFDPEAQRILELVKENSGLKISDLYNLYGNDMSYRTFYRKIEELDKNNMIDMGDKKGKSPVVNYSKKLTEF
ncbi:MAG: AAA family ATPase [Candidatus Woesearchaeota archaeon]